MTCEPDTAEHTAIEVVINWHPMAHPLEAIIRDAYAAFGRGDIDGYLGACTEDFTFHVPGHGGIAGDYAGRQGLYDLAGKAMSITGGTFHEDVEDVLANDDHAVVLARHRFTRDGALKDYRTAHVYVVRAGRLAQCFEQPRDPDSFDDAWGLRLP
jgi:ketosteroid isomerase-like protein